MRPFVVESRAFPLPTQGSGWSGVAVVTPEGAYGGPAVYLPGTAAHRALQDDNPSSYLVVEGGYGNEFILEFDEPPTTSPVTVRFSWAGGEYSEESEKRAIWVAYGDRTPTNSFNATEIAPMMWETRIFADNDFRSNTLRLATRSADPRTLHVWSVEVGGDAPLRGIRPLRQRQSLVGGGSWPLRQRQNGAHSGAWPLRQRQIGA